MTGCGLVLSGGGARGAYEAGVLLGLAEVLRLKEREASPFKYLTGTSVGAINATWMAAHAHRGDAEMPRLIDEWCKLELDTHLETDMMGLVVDMLGGHKMRRLLRRRPKRMGHALLKPDAFEDIVTKKVDWGRLHKNIETGLVRALVIAALQISNGRTAMFAELTEGTRFVPSKDPTRVPRLERIAPDHVLASAAIPFVFPARRIGHRYYCDGGIRFNTPISPALRCGADRLVIISLLHHPDIRASVPPPPASAEAAYPNPIFLLGKVLDALLLDPIHHDLQVLDRVNRLLSTLEEALTDEEWERVRKTIADHRGVAYNKVPALVFNPTRDIGRIARERAQELSRRSLRSLAVRQLASLGDVWEADLLSFVLFDGKFVERLIEMGRRDVVERSDEVKRFFDGT